jgi:hypothetical protein
MLKGLQRPGHTDLVGKWVVWSVSVATEIDVTEKL